MGNNERKSSRGPPPISPDQLSQLASRLFNPNLEPPRVHYAPTPPSLSMSRLQTHAELDERPYYRIRRFRTWNNAAPPVRLALLDPRRRGHLRRYQTFATPNIGIITRGQFVTLYDPSTRPRARVLTPRPLVLPVSPIPAPGMPKIKLTRTERKARYARLLQFKFTLDQEHERRFRKGMRLLMAYAIDFERDNTIPCEDWETGKDLWRPDANILEMKQWTQFYRDIRKKSQNIYHYLQETDINPVPRRDELKKAVKAEEDRRAVNRERKQAKKRAKEEEAERLRQERLIEEQEQASSNAVSELNELLEQKALLQGLIDREERSNSIESSTADQLEKEQFVEELIDMMSDTASEPDDQLRTPVDAKPNRLLTHNNDIDASSSIRGSMVYKTGDPKPSYEVHNEMAQSLAAMIMDMQKQSSRNQSSGQDDSESDIIPISRHSTERTEKKKRTLIVIRSPKGVDNATLARLLPELLGPASREKHGDRPRLRPSRSSESRRKGDAPASSISGDRVATLGDLQELVEPSAVDLVEQLDGGSPAQASVGDIDTVDHSAVTDLGRIGSLNMDDDTAIPGRSQLTSAGSTRGTSSMGWSDSSTIGSDHRQEELHEVSADHSGGLDQDTMTGVSEDGDTLLAVRPSRAVARAW